MRMFKWIGSIGLAALVAGGAAMVGCGDDDGGGGTPDARPAADASGGGGTVTVNFGPVDDSVNQVYEAGDLEWKGNMTYDPATNKVEVSSAGWDSNMWAPLYDDGPVPTGHEPPGSTAGDHKWGVQVLVDKPATGMIAGEYGLNDKTYRLAGFNGWVWPPGDNGTFTVTSTSTSVNAPGMTFAAFGTTDLQITLDTTMLAPRDAGDAGAQTWDTSSIKVKSSAWGWGEVPITKDGSGKAILTLSDVTGAGHTFAHNGLAKSGDKVEFVWVFGTDEYKVGGNAAKMGVTAMYKPTGGSFMATSVQGGDAASGNTYIMVP